MVFSSRPSRLARVTNKPNLVVISRRGRDSLPTDCWAELNRLADVREIRSDGPLSRIEAATVLADAELLGVTNLCLPPIDAELLDRLTRLRGIVLYATGYDHLDVPLLHSRGIELSVLPRYATTAVAEHAIAMLMALATRLHLANDRSRGECAPDVSLRGIELSGRTLGVIGVGRIGRRVARLARSLGMRVVATDIDPLAVLRARASGIRTGELAWVLARSDAVAVCASHRFGAGPLLGASDLVLMRKDALLVNVARAGLVDTDAAITAVRAGRLRGYAVDDTVVDPARDGDLLAEGRVLQTGHSAWWRDEVIERGARMWGERLIAAARGRPRDLVTGPRVGGQPIAADDLTRSGR
jgi:phosphoglycerate dehydrogenase-like enzyme